MEKSDLAQLRWYGSRVVTRGGKTSLNVRELVLDTKVVAIVRGISGDYVQLARALYDGGIRAMEVTFDLKNPDTFEKTTGAIRQIRAAMDEKMAVGAGTVATPALAALAFTAGAQFIVSPDTDPSVIQRAKELGMCAMPGAMTPTEVKTAYDAGADFVKLFPASVLGSEYIKAIRGPLGHVPLLAVGGVNEDNAASFIRAGCVGVGAGGNLVNRTWISEGQWTQISALAGRLCASVRL